MSTVFKALPDSGAVATAVSQGCGYSCFSGLWLQLFLRAVAAAVSQGCGYSCFSGLWLQLFLRLTSLSLFVKGNIGKVQRLVFTVGVSQHA